MTPKQKVLFFTNSENGQSNVVLASAYELLQYGNIDVHIASFSNFEGSVLNLRSGFWGCIPASSSVTFHAIMGLSMGDTFMRNEGRFNIAHECGTKAALHQYPILFNLLTSPSPDEYVEQCQSCLAIIKAVGADLIVIDKVYCPGQDAAIYSASKYMILSPQNVKDNMSAKETVVGMVKYPALCSGYPYPLPWSYIPANIYLNIRMVLSYTFSSAHKQLNRVREAAGFKCTLPLLEPYLPDVTYIIAGTTECDFKIKAPPNFILCGGLFLPARPLSEVDPKMESWLSQGPTVLLNLGSNMPVDDDYATELAIGLRIMLDRNPKLQVLWKLKTDFLQTGTQTSDLKIYSGVMDVLGKEITGGSVRIEKWIKAETMSILNSGHIVCFIHHGGANSYFEAVSAGVPQVVLPCWFDTYEYASRVEYLGIGIHGSKSGAAPKAKGAEFGKALVTITAHGSAEGYDINQRAKALASVCNKYGGRATAAKAILKIINEEKSS